MTIASNLGFPPLGAARELKRATEGYWSGKVSRAQLLTTGTELRRRHWQLQRDIGLDRIPANDFSFYDRMLDTCALVGAVPPRYGFTGEWMDADTYFAMPRARSHRSGAGRVRARLHAAGQARRQTSAPRRDVFRRARRQPVDGARVAGARLARGFGARPAAARSVAGQMAQGSGAVGRRHRRPQRVAGRSAAAAGSAREGGGEGGQGPVVGRAVLLAAAHATRPRSRDQARRGAQGLAGVCEAEAAGGRVAGEGGPRGHRGFEPCRAVAAHVEADQ